MKRKITILYQDDEVIAVHKPSGLTVYPEDGSHKGLDCQTLLRSRFKQNLFPVHRLDKGTCGVLLFALDSRWGNVLRQAFFQRRVKKIYHALVWGKASESGSIQTPLKSQNGKSEAALTRFKKIRDFELTPEIFFSWLEVEPKTGRFHQIRKHLKSIQLPILGDEKYGNREFDNLFLGAPPYKISRPLLSAVEITFPHPKKHKRICVRTRPDSDFRALLEIKNHHKLAP